MWPSEKREDSKNLFWWLNPNSYVIMMETLWAQRDRVYRQTHSRIETGETFRDFGGPDWTINEDKPLKHWHTMNFRVFINKSERQRNH